MTGHNAAELTHSAARGWLADRRAGGSTRADLEQAVDDVYRAARLRPPRVLWSPTPEDYMAVAADPRAHAARLLAGRTRLRRQLAVRPRLLRRTGRSIGCLLAFPIFFFLVTIGASLGGLLAVRIAAGILTALGDTIGSSLGGAVFLIVFVAQLAVLYLVVTRVLGPVARGALRRGRGLRWFADPPEPVQLQLRTQWVLAPLAWRAWRGAFVVLESPDLLEQQDVDAGHELITVAWGDGPRRLFVDGEPVPRPPGPGEAGRQGERFGRDWAARHLASTGSIDQRAEIEQAVTAVYAALRAPAPAMVWCPTPASYRQALAAPVHRLVPAGQGVASRAQRLQGVLATVHALTATRWAMTAAVITVVVAPPAWVLLARPDLAASPGAVVLGLLGWLAGLVAIPVLVGWLHRATGHPGRLAWQLSPLSPRLQKLLGSGQHRLGPVGPLVRQVRETVSAGDPLGLFSARGVWPADLALYRWRQAVSSTHGPPVEESLVAALEASVRVPWVPLRRMAILLEPPRVIRGEIGARTGRTMATTTIEWSGGGRAHLLDQVQLPKPADHPSDWTVAEIEAIPNTEARRVLIDLVGWDRYLTEARLTLIATADDPANPPHQLRLYRADDDSWDGRNLLRMTNASPGRDGWPRHFVEFVPSDITDPVAAAAWQYGVPVDVYAALARRT